MCKQLIMDERGICINSGTGTWFYPWNNILCVRADTYTPKLRIVTVDAEEADHEFSVGIMEEVREYLNGGRRWLAV